MSESLKSKTVRGVFWSGIERYSVKFIHFLVTIVLARILTPDDFGLIGMLTVFMLLAQSLIDSGFTQALIRKQNRTEDDKNTIFFFNIFASILVYLLLYLIAPCAASFFHQPKLVDLMRILCLMVIIDSFSIVPIALFSATLNFKILAKATTLSAILSGIVGVFLAYRGFGVWALVFQQLSSSLFNTMLLWYYSNWKPKLFFSWKSFKEMYVFGVNLMFVGIIETLYQNSYQIFIGRYFSANSLGHFTQAKLISSVFSSSLTVIIGRVTYSIMSSIQNDNLQLYNFYSQSARALAFGVFPVMCGMAAIANPLIEVLIGSQWHFAAILIVPLSFSFMFHPIHIINMNVLQVKGKSRLYLKSEMIKKVISIGILVGTIPFGIIVMCYGRILSSVLTLLINMFYTSKQIEVSLFVLIKDLIPFLGLSFSMFGVVWWVISSFENVYIQLGVGTIIGIALYLGGAYLLKIRELDYYILLTKKLNHGIKRFY